jgi:hypothetical protein
MMRTLIILIFFLEARFIAAQTSWVKIPSSSILYALQPRDSVIYYQCCVKEHFREENTPAGEIVTGKIERYSVTHKFVVRKENGDYLVTEYISPYTKLPNRRFSGLKIRERPYWEFTKERSFLLSGKGLQNLVAMESQAVKRSNSITRLQNTPQTSSS